MGPDNLESRQNGQDKVKEPSGSTCNHPGCQPTITLGVNLQEPGVSTCNHPRSAARVCLIFQLRIDVDGHFDGIVLARRWNGFGKKVEWFWRNGGMVLAGRSNGNAQFIGQKPLLGGVAAPAPWARRAVLVELGDRRVPASNLSLYCIFEKHGAARSKTTERTQELPPFLARSGAKIDGGRGLWMVRVCGIDSFRVFTSIGEVSAPNSRYRKSYGYFKLTLWNEKNRT